MEKEFNLSEKIWHSAFMGKIDGEGDDVLSVGEVKEFIKRDWFLTCYFLWDLFRKWEISEDVVEKQIAKLSKKKDKLAGPKFIQNEKTNCYY